MSEWRVYAQPDPLLIFLGSKPDGERWKLKQNWIYEVQSQAEYSAVTINHIYDVDELII